MCGRFVISSPADSVAKWFGTRNATPNSRPRYNVAPTDDVLAVRFNPETKERTLDALRWGLVPYWAKDIKIGYSLINAKGRLISPLSIESRVSQGTLGFCLPAAGDSGMLFEQQQDGLLAGLAYA